MKPTPCSAVESTALASMTWATETASTSGSIQRMSEALPVHALSLQPNLPQASQVAHSKWPQTRSLGRLLKFPETSKKQIWHSKGVRSKPSLKISHAQAV